MKLDSLRSDIGDSGTLNWFLRLATLEVGSGDDWDSGMNERSLRDGRLLGMSVLDGTGVSGTKLGGIFSSSKSSSRRVSDALLSTSLSSFASLNTVLNVATRSPSFTLSPSSKLYLTCGFKVIPPFFVPLLLLLSWIVTPS